jgi:hypothetical protein
MDIIILVQVIEVCVANQVYRGNPCNACKGVTTRIKNDCEDKTIFYSIKKGNAYDQMFYL